MRSNMWKRMIALACAGIMVVGGSSWSTVSVKAAEEAPSLEALSVEEAPALEAFGVEEQQVETYAANDGLYLISADEEAGFVKGTVAEKKVLGTSEGNHVWDAKSSASGYKKLEISQVRTNSYQGTEGGRASILCDGIISDANYWHSRYNNDAQGAGTKATHSGAEGLTGNNNIIIELKNGAQTVKGVTFLPRQHGSCPNGTVSLFNVYVCDSNGSWTRVQDNGVDITFQAHGKDGYSANYDEEFVFPQVYSNITKVRLEIKQAQAPNSGNVDVITATEVGVFSDVTVTDKLKAELKTEIDALTALKYANVYEQNELNQRLEAANQVWLNSDATISQLKEALVNIKAPISFSNINGTGKYLSDLPRRDETSGWESHFGVKDLSLDGEVLNLIVDGKEQTFKKGIGVHASEGNGAKSNIIYDFGSDQTYKMFESIVGIHNGQGFQGCTIDYAVYLTNSADGNGFPQFLSEPVKTGTLKSSKDKDNAQVKGDLSKRVVVDLSGNRYMKIECHAGGQGNHNWGGHVNWADAKVYTQVKEYTVTVDGQNAQKYLYDDLVVVEATKPDFKAWSINGKVISTNRTYSFRVSNDVDLVQETVEAPIETQVLISNPIVSASADKENRTDVKFVGQIIVPSGTKPTEMGLDWTGRPGVFEDIKLVRVRATGWNDIYQFSITLRKCPNGKTVRGRIYAVIEGQEKYSDVKSINTLPTQK